ncbi:ferritin-like domain-containing protein [Sparassis latifolia]
MFARSALLAVLSSAALVAAAPAAAITGAHRSLLSNTSILNYALTLEFIDDIDFVLAGFAPWVRGRFTQIHAHELSHAEFLTSQLQALGVTPVQACTYSFPYTDVQSWVTLSMTLEGVGSAAYMGAANFISDKNVLIASQSIAQVEARHNGWVLSAVNHLQPWDGPYETPLYFSQVFSLAMGFVVECPATNPALPVTVFPALSVSNAAPASGDTITLTYTSNAPNNAGQTYLAWYSGLTTIFTPIENGSTTVPDGLLGTVYAGVVANQSAQTGDATIITGLAVFSFPFGAFAAGNA